MSGRRSVSSSADTWHVELVGCTWSIPTRAKLVESTWIPVVMSCKESNGMECKEWTAMVSIVGWTTLGTYLGTLVGYRISWYRVSFSCTLSSYRSLILFVSLIFQTQIL